MRIEPTSKTYPHRSPNRRKQMDTLSRVTSGDQGSVATENSARTIETSISRIEENRHYENARRPMSSKRWRSYVPFIAQYIGQETAAETPDRYTRRHFEGAGKAYQKQISSERSPRTVASV